jgi:nitrogen permease regulator 3-like protein
MNEALEISSVAPAMKSLYEAIKSRSLAHLTIHNIPLEVQFPPHLDSVLHSTDDEYFAENDEADSPGGLSTWGRGFTVAWRLPALEPWKSLLLLDGPDNPGRQWMDAYAAIRGTNVILFSPYCNSRSTNHSRKRNKYWTPTPYRVGRI